MNTDGPQLAGQSPQVWTHRFWTHVKEQTGLSILGVLKVVRFSDIEQRIQGFEDDPESAADEQITKWRQKYRMVDNACRDKGIKHSSQVESHHYS